MTSLITPAAQAAAPSRFLSSVKVALNNFPSTTGVTTYVYAPQEMTPLSVPTEACIAIGVSFTPTHTRSTPVATAFLVVILNVAV